MSRGDALNCRGPCSLAEQKIEYRPRERRKQAFKLVCVRESCVKEKEYYTIKITE